MGGYRDSLAEGVRCGFHTWSLAAAMWMRATAKLVSSREPVKSSKAWCTADSCTADTGILTAA